MRTVQSTHTITKTQITHAHKPTCETHTGPGIHQDTLRGLERGERHTRCGPDTPRVGRRRLHKNPRPWAVRSSSAGACLAPGFWPVMVTRKIHVNCAVLYTQATTVTHPTPQQDRRAQDGGRSVEQLNTPFVILGGCQEQLHVQPDAKGLKTLPPHCIHPHPTALLEQRNLVAPQAGHGHAHARHLPHSVHICLHASGAVVEGLEGGLLGKGQHGCNSHSGVHLLGA